MALHLDIPGWGSCKLDHLVLDLNGTLALDGEILPGVPQRLAALSANLAIHLVTADTHGRANASGEALGVRLFCIEPGDEVGCKVALVERLGAQRVVAIGNGANDARMLSVAALGIAVIGREGVAVAALQAAGVVVSRIEDALDMLLQPSRLVATLRR